MWYSILLIFILRSFWMVQSNAITGPSDKIIKRLERCDIETSKIIYLDNYKISKYNRTTFAYNGNVTVSETFSDNNTVLVIADIWGNGGWRSNFYKQKFGKPCTFLEKNLPDFMNLIFETVNITGCPIPPNIYPVKDLPLVVEKVNYYLRYNLYRVSIILMDGDEKIGCFRVIVDVVPK